MARRHHSKHKSRALALYRPSAPKPIVIRTTKVVKHKKHHRRHHGSGFGLGGLMNKQRIGIVAGALAFGFLEKQALFQQLPSLPLIGKAGTVGLAAYLLSNGGKNALANDIATAAFVIAAHEFGSTGTIVGDEAPGIGYVAGY